jgi:diacylglycerol kinase (ATP)
MRALLVANPHAGQLRDPAAIVELAGRLTCAGLEVKQVIALEAASVAGALREALVGRRPEETRVIVAGGDGSIRTVLPAVMDTPFPLALIPMGTVNVLARELGVPLEVEAAIALAASGTVRQVDLGVANGRPFALMAGLGFDAEVVHTVAPQVKNLMGPFAYVARGLTVLAHHHPSHFRISTESEVVEGEAWLAVVTNSPRYAYRWRLSPDAALDDGWLDLCLFESAGAAAAAGQVVAVLQERHATHPGVRHVRARRFCFETDPAVCVQLDGDPEGMTPLTVEVHPGALSVIVPRAEELLQPLAA